MKTEPMTKLFDKLNELKYLFLYGQKIIPVIQGLIDFMKDTVPLIQNINSSIADSTSKIPKARHQINNVTSATELATTEILDIVDSISGDVDQIENISNHLTEKEKFRKELFLQLTAFVGGNHEAQGVIDEIKKNDSALAELSKIKELIQKIKTDSTSITLSLQVQDITSQQLAAVNHLIEAVQEKLGNLVVNLENNELEELKNSKIFAHQNAAFNPDARYTKSADNQEMVDSLINKGTKPASQEEIDKLFL